MQSILRWLAIVILTFSACSTRPVQQPFQTAQLTKRSILEQKERWKREKISLEAEYNQALSSDRSLDPIRGKIALAGGPGEVTFDMLVNNSKPTEHERAAILKFAKLRELFLPRAISNDKQYANPFRRINEAHWQAVTALIADLYNGSLTYGEFAKKRQEISSIKDEARDRMRSALAAERADREQAYLDRFKSFLLLQQTLQRQQQISLQQSYQKPPKSTICTQVGNMLFCD